METKEAYRALGLDHSASDAELKASWRKLVATWHPDRNPAAEAVQRMQAINKAYQHIRLVREGKLAGDAPADSTDSTYGADSPQPEAPAHGSAHPQADAQADPQAHTHRPPHVRKVRLSLEEACLGCTRTVRGQFTQTCSTCVGAGQRVLATACPTCRGKGAVRKPVFFGWSWTEEACPDCSGDGRQRAPCEPCDNTGTQTVSYRRRVRFPAGTRDGHVLSVPAARHGDLEVDLELAIEIEPHPLFTLDDNGVLRCEMPVNGYAWMTGRWVDVPTPDGLQHMRLTRDALVYRLAGKGFPATPNGPRGDFMVRVAPVFPPLDDPQQADLLDQLIASSTQAAQADDTQPLGQWARRLKSWQPG